MSVVGVVTVVGRSAGVTGVARGSVLPPRAGGSLAAARIERPSSVCMLRHKDSVKTVVRAR